MKELALRDGGQVVLSDSLQNAIWVADEPVGRYPGIGPNDPGLVIQREFSPTTGAVEEAQRIVPLIPQIMAPVSMMEMRKWLKMLNGAVRNPQDGEDFDIRLTAFGFALRDYPRQCFSDTTLRDAMRTFTFFPSAADLCTLLDEVAVPLRRRMDAIRRTADYVKPIPEPATSRRQMSDEERAEQALLIRAKVTALKAILSEEAELRAVATVVAPVEPEKLIAIYRKALATQPWLSDEYRKATEAKLADLLGSTGDV